MSITVDNTAHTYPAIFCWLCLAGVFLATGEWITSIHQAQRHPVLLALLAVVIPISSGLLARGLSRPPPVLAFPLALLATVLSTAFIVFFIQAFASIGIFHVSVFGRRFGFGTAVLTGLPVLFVAYAIAGVPVALVADVVAKRRRVRTRAPMEAAIAEARDVVRLEPDNAAAHLELARALMRKWSLESRTIPNAADGFMNAEYRRRQQELVDAAAVALHDAARLAPDSADAHRELGYALVRQEKVDDAIAELRKSIELASDVTARLTLARLLLEGKEDVQSGMAEYREAIRMYPDVGEAHYRLGKALERVGDREAALAELQRARELDPANRGFNYDYEFLRRQTAI